MASYQYVYVMNGLSKSYPGGKQVFKDIRLSFHPGAKIGVVGVNGAGKSTLLKIMAGVEKDFGGEAWAADGARVGYLAQEPQLDPEKDVLGNVMDGVARQKKLLDDFNAVSMKLGEDYSDALMEEMTKLQEEIDAGNLWDLDGQVEMAMDALRCPPPDAEVLTLSGGEKRRVALCRLLLEKPELLLLDEPTNHLDISAQLSLLTFVRSLGVTTVAALHDLNLAATFCDHVLVLSEGRLAAAGDPADVLTPNLLREVYQVDADVLAHPATGRPVIAFSGNANLSEAVPLTP